MAGRDRNYAVLTGDLVKSSRLAPAESRKAIALLKKAASDFEKTFPGTIEGELDSFRHDSWQLLLKRPALAVRAAIFLRAALRMQPDLRKCDTRVAIGIGPVETISRRRVSDSRGAAFTRSGTALDATGNRCLAFASSGEREDECVARAVAPLLDSLISDWTATESRAVYGALRDWTQEESARQWPVARGQKRPTRQAVAKALRRAHWNQVQSVLDWLEKSMQPLRVAN